MGMLAVVQILLQSCTGLGKISEGEYLLTEYKLTFKNKHDISNFKQAKQQLEDKQNPDPNGKFLYAVNEGEGTARISSSCSSFGSSSRGSAGTSSRRSTKSC